MQAGLLVGVAVCARDHIEISSNSFVREAYRREPLAHEYWGRTET